MVLVDGKSNPRAAFEFLAEIWMWEKTSEAKQLQKSYQPVINTQTTKQACTIIFENTELKELLLLKNKSKSIDMKKEEYDKREKHKNSFKEVVSATQKQRKKKNNKSVQEIINEIHDEKQLEVSNDIKNKNDKKEKNCNLKNSPIKQKKDPIIIIHPNQKNLLRLRFMYYPEYIQEGQKLLINDTSLKSVGWIKEIYY